MDLTRRMFIKRSSVAVAVAGAAVSAMPLVVDAVATAGPEADAGTAALPETASMTEPVIARLADVGTGEVHIFVGTQQLTVNDPQLASLLYRASR